MMFYNKEQLYLETDMSINRIEACLQQVRNRMGFPKDKASDNSVPCPIAFESKSLINTETHYSNSN